MVERRPVRRQLPGVIQVEERGELGEALTGNPEPSHGGNAMEGVETIPQGSSSEVLSSARSASLPNEQIGSQGEMI